ncbi:MAG: RNA polymerase sigma factor [Parvularculaceae bacterium]
MSRLLRAFLDNETAIRRIVARYRRRGNDVDDLVQETFLRAFAANEKEEVLNPKGFLFRVAKNLAISEAKRKANSTTDYIEDSGGEGVIIDESQSSIEDQVDGEKKLFVFTKAVADLPPELRQALLMRKMEKLKFKQIATRLNVSVSTVEKRVAAALIACNAYLRKHGYDPAEFGAAPTKTKSGEPSPVLTISAREDAEAETRKRND